MKINKIVPESQWKVNKKRRVKSPLFWTILYLLGMFAYTAIMFGLSIGAVATILNFKDSNDYGFTQEILINWRKNYISDITAVTGSGSCPSGYELWHDRKWPGIKKGCNCIDNNGDFRKMVIDSECSELQLNSKCTTVDALSEVPLVYWKESTKICVKRGDTSFLSSPENCGTGLRKCGSGKVRYCIPDSSACPISGVVISDSVEMLGYTKVVMSDTTNLFYTRDESNFPVSTFKLTETDYCIFDGKNHITPGRMDYVLSNEKRTPCVRTESRYISLDSQGEKSMYQTNNLYTTLTRIPGYPRPFDDTIWELGYERYFQWDDLCRNGPFSLTEAEKKIQLTTLEQIAWIAFGVTVLSIVVTGILLPVSHLKDRIREEDIKEAYRRKGRKPPVKNQRKFFTSKSYLADKVFKLILLPAVVLAIFISQRENKWFTNVQSSQCGDDITNSYFQTYASKINEIFSIYIALLFIWLALLGLDFLYALYLLFKTKIGFGKFFESKIHRDEEKIVIISEDELRGLRKGKDLKDSQSKIAPSDD